MNYHGYNRFAIVRVYRKVVLFLGLAWKPDWFTGDRISLKAAWDVAGIVWDDRP